MKTLQNKWDRGEVESILARLKDKPGPLMVILHEVQNRLGYIPRDSVPMIAHALNLSRAEVHGVITFYRDFHFEPQGRHVVKVCRAESCQAMGGEALATHATQRLGVEFGAKTDDGDYTLEPVYCLGNCACSPAIMVDEELYGRVSPDRFDNIIAALKETSG